METQTMELMPKKKSVYYKQRYEQNKEDILKYRHERYWTTHQKDLNIKLITGTFTFISIKLFCIYNIIMYVLIGKEKCIQFDILKNLFDEKGIQYHYLDMMEMPHKTLTYLRMYCNSYPMVLSVNCFSTNKDILEHFRTL